MSQPRPHLRPRPNIRLEIQSFPTREHKETLHSFLLTEHKAIPSGDGSYLLYCEGPELEALQLYVKAAQEANIQIEVMPIGEPSPCGLTQITETERNASTKTSNRMRTFF